MDDGGGKAGCRNRSESVDLDRGGAGGFGGGYGRGGFGEGGYGRSGYGEGGFGEGGFGSAAFGEEGAAEGTEPQTRVFKVNRYDFIVQFCWQPTTRAQRRQILLDRQEQERLAAEAAAAEAEADASGGAPAADEEF